jgi:hypothetical protein
LLDTELFSSIAQQMMNSPRVKVKVRAKPVPVRRTNDQQLKTVTFVANGRKYTAIEQNPQKTSRWAKLAVEGHQVVQFKDVKENRFVAVAVDGVVKEYSPSRS